MKTVAVRLTEDELDELRDAYVQFLSKVEPYKQRGSGLDLLALWFKLEAAADEAGSIMLYDDQLPKWARGKLLAALRAAGQVETLKSKVEALETRAKARGVTVAAQAPSVTKARKKPARKSKPKPAPAFQVTQPAQVS